MCRSIKKKKLFVSDVIPDHWFTIDNKEQLKMYNKNIISIDNRCGY